MGWERQLKRKIWDRKNALVCGCVCERERERERASERATIGTSKGKIIEIVNVKFFFLQE